MTTSSTLRQLQSVSEGSGLACQGSAHQSAFSPAFSPKFIISNQLTHLNTLYVLSPSLSELSRDTLREYDLEPSERDSLLIDAFSPLNTTTTLLYPGLCATRNGPLLSDSTLTGGPIVYPHGTAWTLGLNPYLMDVLHAPRTAYVGEERMMDADEIEVEAQTGGRVIAGQTAGLVSAFQTRENVRIGFVGSLEMIRDQWWGSNVVDAEGRT